MKAFPNPLDYWRTRIRGQKENTPTEPSVWVMYGHAGDFNNGLAVALALSPNRTRIITGMFGFLASEKDKNSVETYFAEPSNENDRSWETIHFNHFPDVFINSTISLSHAQIRGLGTGNHLRTFDNTLSVHMATPDNPVRTDTFIPQTDMNIMFRHQADSASDIVVPNAYIYDTVPSRVNERALAEGRKLWGKELEYFQKNRPVYFVVIGERIDGNEALSLQDAEIVAAKVMESVKKTGGSIMVTTAPRTKNAGKIMAAFTSRIQGAAIPFYFYDYNKVNGQQNPYDGLLALADKIIVTDDSMSMLGDGAATSDRQVYCYRRLFSDPSKQATTKNFGHQEYSNSLMQQGRVMPLDRLDEPRNYPIAPVNSAEQIAGDIRALLKMRQAAKAGGVRTI